MKEKREQTGLSLRQASRLSGVSHTHIRDIENGSSVPSFEMVMGFLETYRIEIEEFLKETGYLSPEREAEQKDRIKQIPILSWTQAGHWRECANSPQEDWEFMATDSKGTFALRVRGDSMEPEFHQEDIIVINPYLKAEHNDYVVVCNEEWEATFKQLKKYGKVRVLHPLNAKYEDIELGKNTEYRIIGVVVEKKKKYR
ncbi:MAG: helix-turn-helix domain-containing protein [SAR324 cluster bacterium]|nr:helix-turn-helix domain-containing protein [SAR324 cluster bacterium]